MLNLLPQQHKEILSKEYAMRRVVVGLALFLVVLVVSLLLLTPSYFLTQIRAEETRIELESVRRTLDAKLPPEEVVTEITRAVRDAGSLRPLKNNRSVYELFKIFESRPSSIRILEVSFGSTSGGVGGENVQQQISVRGIAADRESLTSFGRLLESRPEFESVNVPVSSFVKERDIDFLMTLVLKPR